jgi:outer membrane protein assembly factor BamB
MKRFLSILAAALLLASSVHSADWSGFRGPNSAAVSKEKDLPAKWSATDNVSWKAALPGRGLSNPIITNGKVIVTACSGFKQRRLHVLAFEEKTGKKLWERQFTATGNTQCHPTTNMAAPTPVTDGKAVYALFATGDLAALDLAGNLLWYRSLVSDYPDITNQVGLASSPGLWKDVLLLPMDSAGESFAAGVDTKTGKNLWKQTRSRKINWVSPIVVEHFGKPAAIFYSQADITAYDPATGKVLWTLTDRGASDTASPTQGAGMLFVPAREFVALKPGEDGATPEVAWKSNKLRAGGASPLYHDGAVYGLTDVGLRCLDAKDGSEKWLQRVTGKFWASPVIADGKAYVTDEGGKVTVIQLGDKPDILATNDVGQKLLATPAIANGALYLRSDETLFCIRKPR